MRVLKKYSLFLLVFLTAGMLLLAGCSQGSNEKQNQDQGNPEVSENKTETRTIQHEMGETPLEGTPKRIVVLEFSFIDALASLGVSPVGIADDGKSDIIIKPIAEKIGEYTSVGTRKEPSLEIISSLQPDLIIADLKRHKGVYEELNKIAPTIVLKSLESTYQENLASFKVIAEAVGASDVAEKRLVDHEDLMKELRVKIGANESRTVLPAVVTKDLFNAHAAKSYTGELLEQLGFKNAIQQEEAYADLGLEQLVETNPDVLFLMIAEEKTIVDEWKKNPLWKDLKAVKNGQVYEVNRDLWSKFRGVIASEMIGQEAIELLDKK